MVGVENVLGEVDATTGLEIGVDGEEELLLRGHLLCVCVCVCVCVCEHVSDVTHHMIEHIIIYNRTHHTIEHNLTSPQLTSHDIT